MKLPELKFIKHNDNVYFVECGYHKHFIYMENCDVLNTLILFSVMAFDNFYIHFACDDEFWREWISFYCSSQGIEKNIEFRNTDVKPIDKLNDKVLFYSGGKDSYVSRILLPNIKIMQYKVQVYKVPIEKSAEIICTNFDNELFHSRKYARAHLKLELYLPIISPYRTNYLGIEKEIWYDGVRALGGMSDLGYNLVVYSLLLKKYGMTFDSPVKEYYSKDLLKRIKFLELDNNFIKCNSSDAGKENKFCLDCEKCLTYYIQGCNMKEHSFDRKAWEEQFVGKYDISDFEKYLYYRFIEKDKGDRNKFDYFLDMWRTFNEKQ